MVAVVVVAVVSGVPRNPFWRQSRLAFVVLGFASQVRSRVIQVK